MDDSRAATTAHGEAAASADTRMFRMKKWAASRVARSRAGRPILTRLLGVEGAAAVDELQAVWAAALSARAAAQLQTVLLRFVAKAAVYVQDGRFDGRDAAAVADADRALLRAGTDLIAALRSPSEESEAEEEAAHPVLGRDDAIVSAVRVLEATLSAAVSPVMKEKHVAWLRQLCAASTSKEVLDYLVHHDGPAHKLADALDTLVSGGPPAAAAAASQTCSQPGCSLPQLLLVNGARAGLCVAHFALRRDSGADTSSPTGGATGSRAGVAGGAGGAAASAGAPRVGEASTLETSGWLYKRGRLVKVSFTAQP